MALKQRINTAYGVSQGIVDVLPFPIKALRNPGTTDRAEPGTVWTNTSTNDVFILASITNNVSTWVNVSGGAGTFDSLTVDPGPVDINGDVTVDGATFSLDATTASNVTVTGAGQDLTLSSVGGSVVIDGSEAAPLAVSINASNAGGSVSISAGDAITLSTTAIAGRIEINAGTVTQAGAAATLNSYTGIVTLTGLTTAAAATETLTITNADVTADSGIIATLSNKGGNDAQMTITRIIPAAGSFTVQAQNLGAAALNGDLILSYIVLI